MRPGEDYFLKTIRVVLWTVALAVLCFVSLAILPFLPRAFWISDKLPVTHPGESSYWQSPDSTRIPDTGEGELIRYGRELVARTSVYLGPQGKVSHISNGMNCQNCHLKAGKKIWGNNYSAVASTYPKFRSRSGTVESIERRINDCLQRSLNGQPLNEQSREMQAFVAYIKWVGSEVPKGTAPEGSGIAYPPLLDRAADPKKGESIYVVQCARCHGVSGKGMRARAGNEWLYPPLWGDDSFNVGAGILRLSRMAGFIQRNMPNDIQGIGKKLSDADAWDVAAFICSQPRPQVDLSGDWPDLSQKPFDYPFGPYADAFSEEQHKYGPFLPIQSAAAKK
jgi:thiosulfate dehydrogenase